MANPNFILNGQSMVADSLIDPGGTGHTKAAGDPIAVSGYDDSAPMLVQGLRGALTDKSGTIASGGTAQTLAAILATRRYLFIQNVDPAEDLWINFTTAAVVGQPSIRIPAGAAFEMDAGFVSPELVSVNATTTGHPFTAKES